MTHMGEESFGTTPPTRGGGGRRVASARSIALLALRRLGVAVIVLWGAVTVTFIGLHLVPGNPVDTIIGQNSVTPAVRAQITKQYGLDKPIIVQYFTYLGRLLRGDLGQSFNQGLPVSKLIGQQAGSSLALVAAGIVISVLGAIVVATLTANRPRWIRGPFAALEVIGIAVPAFWLGILLLTAFSFNLHWFPVIGTNGFKGLVLPGIALAVAPGAMMSQVLRQSLERTLDEPFIVTARSRGLSATAVLVRHALRHAILPIVTLAGYLAGAFISGAVVIENVFSRQGLGQLTVEAINNTDFTLVAGVVLVSAIFYVVINLLIDLAYPLIDPRLRSAQGGIVSFVAAGSIE